MKSFKSYISEEVLPTANVQDGNFDVSNDAVRSQVNATLAAVTAQPAVTPYVLLRKVSKALAYFHIILPKRTFLEGSKGVEVYEVMQFGDKMGMNDQGEFVNEVPAKFYLFFQYGIVHPFNVTYTKPNIDGMYRGMAKIVDQVELDKLLNAAEAVMAESCGCDDKATMSQRKAGREEIHPETPSTKKATADSEKGLKESMTRKQKDMAVRRFMSHDPDAGERILAMGKKERAEKKSFASAKKEIKRLKEEQIDELKKSTLASYIKKAHVSGLEAASQGEIAYARKDKAGLRAANKTGEKREQGIERAAGKLAKEETLDELKKSTLASYIKKAAKNQSDHSFDHGEDEHRQYGDRGEDPHRDREVDDRERKISNREKGIGRAVNKLSMKESRMPASVIAHKQKLASMTPEELKKKFAGKSEEHLKSMARRHGYGKDSDVYSKHVKEESLDEAKKKKILVTLKKDPHAKAGGGVIRIPKDQYDPKKHNLASE